ncbi:hypothetical protein BCIN_08g04410 [Botrytis cinerea B05.10]|uniref:Uncharacterized protein n=1 Tax=Botryotinia fuckeliana (strain B05.10) TaxID=332648 RepID=A0A384JQM0_BOTFB|nr:hypothetical protein BCIN_08g04410 [Botrytis cinerea B05.10]ATZ52810.1 hypothetical protein BCIN_08g04410 [Botrytis cinerea B05.10]
MPFEFINNAEINRAARKRIRSHVALGRNAGKKLVRPSKMRPTGMKRVVTSAGINLEAAQIDSIRLEQKDSEENSMYEIERQVGDSITCLSLPNHAFKDRKIIQRTFSFISGIGHPVELSKALIKTQKSTSIFVQFMVSDEACLHCGIAVSVTALNNVVVNREDPKIAMHHLSLAFRLINDKLSGNDAVADTTIAVVLTMSHYYRLQGQFSQGLIHLEGIERMVKMRGGISNFKREQFTLAQKIFRADLEYSLHWGTRTRYSSHDIESNDIFCIIGSKNPDFYKKQAVSCALVSLPLSTGLLTLLVDIIHFAWLLNEAIIGRAPPLCGYKLHNTLLFFGYRLLSMYPLGGCRPKNSLENAIHLGLTSFIVTFMRGLDGKVPGNSLLASLIRSSAQELSKIEHGSPEALLWLLLMGKASIFGHSDDTWLASDISQTMQVLGLQGHTDVQQKLENFPWVYTLHDKEVRALLQSIEGSNSDNLSASRKNTNSHNEKGYNSLTSWQE